MIYELRQRSRYWYNYPVATSRHSVRMVPTSRPGQKVLSAELEISPSPSERHERTDFFGNALTFVAFDYPHDRLAIEMRARVQVEPPTRPDAAGTPAWERVRDSALSSASLDPDSPIHGLFPSRNAPLAEEVTDWTAASFAAGRPVLEGLLDLVHRVKTEFAYEPGATDVGTLPDEAFRLRRGVCQDFAHLCIAGLRGIGLPVLYVSGYLRTVPPPGEARLEGADATHAWILAWCGAESGWIGLDPTNDVITGSDHVTVAIGRDYADVAPVDGVIVSTGGHSVVVEVDVVPVPSEPQPQPQPAEAAPASH